MGVIFQMGRDRHIYVASQNYFASSAKHPSSLMNRHILSYVLSGGWTIDVNGEKICAKPDQLFIIPANIPNSGIDKCPSDTHTMFIHFEAFAQDRYIPMCPAIVPEHEIYCNCFLDATDHPEIKELLIKVLDENSRGNIIRASAYLNILLDVLSKIVCDDGSVYALGRKAKQIIHATLYKKLTNRELADMLNVGVRTLESAFKTCFGLSIHQYRLQEKIEQAKSILRHDPNIKISKIASSLGFYDEYHFSRQFKRFTGSSPTDYKNQILEIMISASDQFIAETQAIDHPKSN